MPCTPPARPPRIQKTTRRRPARHTPPDRRHSPKREPRLHILRHPWFRSPMCRNLRRAQQTLQSPLLR
eukprot:116411-Pleurochrysis_carterae.AAC.1